MTTLALLGAGVVAIAVDHVANKIGRPVAVACNMATGVGCFFLFLSSDAENDNSRG